LALNSISITLGAFLHKYIMPKKPAQPKTGKSAANYFVLSNDKEDSQIKLSKA
jgi:hypothetical protein